MPWIFLAVSLIGATFSWNAHRPLLRSRTLSAPSFMAGWLTDELAWQHLVWQIGATILFVAGGALAAWPGWLGLAITLGSWWGLVALIRRARSARGTLEASLREVLGPAARPLDEPSLGRLALPFQRSEPGVEIARDIPYVPDDDPRHRLDVYYPTGARSATGDARDPRPVLLQVHGGAWVIGHKAQQALPLMFHMAARGWVCVSANYRLSPRATFPDHLVDLKRAISWIRSNIADYGGDPALVCVTGGSAGGHLSSMLALTANDPEYQPGFETVDTSVAACVPFYGVYDFGNQYGLQPHDGLLRLLERSVMKQALEGNPDAFRSASPLARVHPDAPPFFPIHGSLDGLAPVAEARRFVEELRAISKAPVAYAELTGAQHAFEIFHSIRTSYTIRAVEQFLEWVRLRG